MPLSLPITRSDSAPNGAFRTFGLYWCYHCHRTVRIASSNPSEIACPRCLRQFVAELEMGRPRSAFNHATPPFDTSPETRLLEALSLMFDPQGRSGFGADPFLRGRSRNMEPEPRLRPHHRRRHSLDNVNNGGLPPPRRTYVILRPSIPLGNMTEPPNPRPPPRRMNPHDFFNRTSGLEELIEQLTQDDRPGPPPWLRLHNSCPICRRDLQPLNTIVESQEERNNSVIEDTPERRRPRWMQLGNMWPFRARYQRVSPRGNN